MIARSLRTNLEDRLLQAADAAGSSLACRYDGSAEWHAEAVKAWRDQQPKPSHLGFHIFCGVCLVAAFALI